MKLMQDSERQKPTAKKGGVRLSVAIDARFGSEMQRAVAMRLLDQFLTAWKEAAESHHKKNSIRIIRGSESAPRPVTVRQAP